MSEEKISEQLKQIQELAKKDKTIDVAALIANTLSVADKNTIPVKAKRIAYLVSLGVPLAGFVYAIKYWYSDADDGLETALGCAVLGCVCLIITFLTTKAMTSGLTGANLNSLQPSDVQQLVE